MRKTHNQNVLALSNFSYHVGIALSGKKGMPLNGNALSVS